MTTASPVTTVEDESALYLAATPITRAEFLAKPCPVPPSPGVYGWWFRELPADIDTSGCAKKDGLTLLYTGISPSEPPKNGKALSKENIRTRISAHYKGNAEGSTLRKTLGCLLSDQLGIELRRVGSGNRRTFLEGERVLDQWMQDNALVSWVVHPEPWVLEHQLIASLDVPLNLAGNSRNPFWLTLKGVRAESLRRANELPVMPNPKVR